MDKKEIIKETVKEMTRSFVAEKIFFRENEGEAVVLRIGDAVPIETPVGLKIAGTIQAPARFWDKRKSDHNPQLCHVTYDRNAGRISLFVNETSVKEGSCISGVVVLNPDLAGMKINTNKLFTCKELMDHLKFNRVLFKDREENSKVVTALQMFKVKVLNEKEQSDDFKGNQKNINNFQLTHEFQESFVLSCPIFKGGEPKSFKVDVCISVTDGDVAYWLESRELKELESKDKWDLLDAELKHFEDVVKIEQ